MGDALYEMLLMRRERRGEEVEKGERRGEVRGGYREGRGMKYSTSHVHEIIATINE